MPLEMGQTLGKKKVDSTYLWKQILKQTPLVDFFRNRGFSPLGTGQNLGEDTCINTENE